MSPNGFQLPEGDFFALASVPPIERIWKILYHMDPVWLKNIRPEVINEVKDIYIEYEIMRAEKAVELLQHQVDALKQIQKKVQLG